MHSRKNTFEFIAAAPPIKQKENEKSMEENQDKQLKPPFEINNIQFAISVLNDDCIEEIFRKLDVQDLYSVAMSCQHFLNIACLVFSKQYNTYELADEKILRVFGDVIETMVVKLRTFENREKFSQQNIRKTFFFIKKYCTNILSCSIALPDAHSDFDIIGTCCINWNNMGFLEKITNDAQDKNLVISINTEEDLNDFINRFEKYLQHSFNIFDDNN